MEEITVVDTCRAGLFGNSGARNDCFPLAMRENNVEGNFLHFEVDSEC